MAIQGGQGTEAYGVRDWSLLAGVAAIWGSSFLFIDLAVDHLRPALVTLLRMCFGAATLALLPASRRPVPREDWLSVAAVGVLWMAFPFLLFSIALRQMDSSVAGMLNAAVPLPTTVVAALLAHRLPGPRQRVGLLVGFAGVVTISLPSLGGAQATPLAVALVLLATCCYGIAINIAAPLQRRHGALPVIWRAQLVAVVVLAPLGIAAVPGSTFAPSSVAAVAALGCLGTALAFVLFTTLIGRVGPTRASVAIYFVPVVAIALGTLVRGEALALLSILGTGLVLAGAWLATRGDARPALRVVAPARAATLAALLVAGGGSVVAQEAPANPRSAWPLPRLTGPVRVDGRGDDAAWQAVPALPLTVYLPTHGAPPSERTVARVAYDEDALYVLVEAWEAHEGGVRASTMIRDDDGPGDFVNVLLDTFGDGQNAVNFSTTPGGNRNDWTISNDAQNAASLSPAWNGPWDLATRRGPDGWHAEFRIPFSTLRFVPREGRVEFGLSVNRLTAHSNERVTFPAIAPNAPLALWKPSRMQRVAVEGIRATRSARLTPYVVAGVEGARAPDPAASPLTRDDVFEAGGDLKLALSPNLTLDLSANTDFAETEVDDQRVNLTRFPLLYPERRQFFVERAGTFEVRTGETDLLFNSRRVGLTPAGEPVRLLGGVRLVGQLRGWDIGLFDAQTGRTPDGARENLGVLRLRRPVLNRRSWVGMMVTSRLTADSGQAALGADGELHLGGDDYAGFSVATLAGDAGAGPAGGVLPRGAFRLLVERRRNRGGWYRAGVATTGARYAPALGYVERGDAIRPLAEVGYGRVVSRTGHAVRASVATALAWRNAAGAFEGAVSAATLALDLPGGGTWTLTATRQDDELAQPFVPTPGTSVPAGRHRAGFVQLTLAAPSGPRAVLGGSLRAGEYYDGTLWSLTLVPEWRVSAHLRMAGEVQVDRLDFAARGEREWSTLARLRVLASASPRLSVSAVLQASTLADLATANLRVRYNAREGHDLWVVVGHHANLDRDRVSPRIPGTARASLLIKYTRSFGS